MSRKSLRDNFNVIFPFPPQSGEGTPYQSPQYNGAGQWLGKFKLFYTTRYVLFKIIIKQRL